MRLAEVMQNRLASAVSSSEKNMSTHYDEDDINEQNARDLYYTIRDAIKQSQQAEISLSLAGIAAAIVDEIDDPRTLIKLQAELDECINHKIDAHAEIKAQEYINQGIDKLIGADAEARRLATI